MYLQSAELSTEMKKADSIKIKALLHKDVSTKTTIDGNKYLVITDDLVPKNGRVTTKVYVGGKIVFTRDLDLRDCPDADMTGKKLLGLIHRHHETIVEMLKQDSLKHAKNPSDYLDDVILLLQKKNSRRALDLLSAALLEFPDEPFLLSYYGCLEAVINKSFSYGIENCQRAIEILEERSPVSKEIYYPTFYLNLGRAYVAAGHKKNAIDAFAKGLLYDPENKDILWETRKLGVRMTPAIPYLKRTNPINKYIGMILHRLKKTS